MNKIVAVVVCLVLVGFFFYGARLYFSLPMKLDERGKKAVELCESKGWTLGVYYPLNETKNNFLVECGIIRFTEILYDLSQYPYTFVFGNMTA